MSDAVRDLVLATPRCPNCVGATLKHGDHYRCHDCGLVWNSDGQDGGYINDRGRCQATITDSFFEGRALQCGKAAHSDREHRCRGTLWES